MSTAPARHQQRDYVSKQDVETLFDDLTNEVDAVYNEMLDYNPDSFEPVTKQLVSLRLSLVVSHTNTRILNPKAFAIMTTLHILDLAPSYVEFECACREIENAEKFFNACDLYVEIKKQQSRWAKLLTLGNDKGFAMLRSQWLTTVGKHIEQRQRREAYLAQQAAKQAAQEELRRHKAIWERICRWHDWTALHKNECQTLMLEYELSLTEKQRQRRDRKIEGLMMLSGLAPLPYRQYADDEIEEPDDDDEQEIKVDIINLDPNDDDEQDDG